MKPIRILRRRAKGWRMPPNTVCVTRTGPWGNPFIVGRHGTAAECVHSFTLLCAGVVEIGRDSDCVDAQLRFLKHARAHIDDLRGQNLACFCHFDQPCHADLLLKIANAPKLRRSKR